MNPRKYSPSYSFSGHQASRPSTPLPAQQVDNEFANIATSIGETVDALKDIRRSDGALQNGIVGPNALSPALTVGFSPRGQWSPDSVSYQQGDGVFWNEYFYVALEQHVSDQDYEPGVDENRWLVQFSIATAVGNMLVSDYDPGLKAANVYDVDNHEDGATNKVFTAAEKTKLAGIEEAATASPYPPAGVVWEYAGSTLPDGFLWADGSAVSRTTYATLFAAIGTAFGAGDGSTTFNLPDRRDVVGVGRGDMGGTTRGLLSNFVSTTLGALFGSQSHTLTKAQMPTHDHATGTLATAPAGLHGHPTLVNSGHDSQEATGGLSIAEAGSGQINTEYPSWAGSPSTIAGRQIGGDGLHTHSLTGTIASTGGGQAHNNVQPTIVLNYIIKT